MYADILYYTLARATTIRILDNTESDLVLAMILGKHRILVSGAAITKTSTDLNFGESCSPQ